MRWFHLGLVVGLVVAARAAAAAPEKPRRVVVAGASDDTIAARLQKELVALGFEPVRAPAIAGCTASAVGDVATKHGAVALACANGAEVGIWVTDGTTFQLRDVVAAEGDGAVRAAEITRASLSLHDDEPPTPPDAAGAAGPETALAPANASSTNDDWATFDAPDKPKAAPPAPSRAPRFAMGLGLSLLAGVDATEAALSTKLSVRIARHVALAARLDFPLSHAMVNATGSPMQIQPGLSALGVELPLTSPESRFVPSLGGGAGVVWMHAERFDVFNGLTATSDTSFSPAAYAAAGLSLKVYGPVRLGVDGLFGATASRLVVRDAGVHVAYWGQPFGALALRVEAVVR